MSIRTNQFHPQIELIRRLLSAGAQTIEATAFVDPGRVPQFTDADEVSHPVSFALMCIH